MSNEQIQKAGPNSNQIQTNTLIQINGLTEEQVRDIVNERCELVTRTCLAESKLIAEQRVSEFKTELYNSTAANQNLLTSLREPSCVDSLERAAKAATRSNEPRDKRLLAELLAKRFESPHDRHIATGVNKAIEIVDMLTEEELAGLTVYYVAEGYSPTSPNISRGLETLDSLFQKLPLDILPLGESWIDELDVLDALRVTPFSTLRPLHEYYYDSLSGYTVRGIKLNTDEEKSARELIQNAMIPSDILVDHELNPGYLRVPIRDISEYSHLSITIIQDKTTENRPFDSLQVEAVEKLIEMCKGNDCAEDIKARLQQRIGDFPSLSKVQVWWNSIPSAPRITSVGRCLANANARRLEPSLPEAE